MNSKSSLIFCIFIISFKAKAYCEDESESVHELKEFKDCVPPHQEYQAATLDPNAEFIDADSAVESLHSRRSNIEKIRMKALHNL